MIQYTMIVENQEGSFFHNDGNERTLPTDFLGQNIDPNFWIEIKNDLIRLEASRQPDRFTADQRIDIYDRSATTSSKDLAKEYQTVPNAIRRARIDVEVCIAEQIPPDHPFQAVLQLKSQEAQQKRQTLKNLRAESLWAGSLLNDPEVESLLAGNPHLADLLHCFVQYSTVEPILRSSGYLTESRPSLELNRANEAIRQFLFRDERNEKEIELLSRRLLFSKWLTWGVDWNGSRPGKHLSRAAAVILESGSGKNDKVLAAEMRQFLKLMLRGDHLIESALNMRRQAAKQEYAALAAQGVYSAGFIAFAKSVVHRMRTVDRIDPNLYFVEEYQNNWFKAGSIFLENILLKPDTSELTPELILKRRSRDISKLYRRLKFLSVPNSLPNVRVQDP